MLATASRRLIVLAAAALLLALAAAPAHARTVRGGPAAEVLRGSGSADALRGNGGADRLLGRAGADRLYGGRGNDRLSGGRGADRLFGGPGADRFACGSGRDVVFADSSDLRHGRIAADCEVLRGLPADTDVMPGASPPQIPADQMPAGCKYVTKPVLVLRDGGYVFEQQVVLDCPSGAPAADPPPSTPASRWEPILPEYWFQYQDFAALYRFRPDHTGVRTTYPTGNLSFGTPSGFSWQLAGDVVKLTFPSGYTDLVTLATYDSGQDIIARTSSSTGNGPWYGCRSGQIPEIVAFALC